MKITFLLTQSLESPGGGGRYLPLAKALAREGFTVTILALHHNYAHAKQRKFAVENVRVRYVGQMHVLKEGNHKTYFSTGPLLWIAFLATVRLFWAALWTNADVIQVCKTQPMNGVAAWGVHLLRRTPVFLDSDDYEAVNNRFVYEWQQKVVAWFERWMPSFASGITAGTSYIEKQFLDAGYPEQDLEIVRNGVERARFSILKDGGFQEELIALRHALQIKDEHNVVVYIGSMSLVSHAIDLLLEAFVQVLHKEPNTLLILVGSGEDLPHLQQMAFQLGVSEYVRFTGRVSFAETPMYYFLGDVSVDPRRNSIEAESSLSLKLLESIAAGVPCVTADSGDRKAVVGDAGIAVLPDDSNALAAGILRILQNPALSVSMQQAAYRLRDNNWWEQRAQIFIGQYKRVLEEGEPSDNIVSND